MARGFSVTVEGLDKVQRNLRPEQLGPPMRTYLRRVNAAGMRQVSKRLTKHKFSGALAGSMTRKTDQRPIPRWTDIIIGEKTGHAKQLEYGTKPHFPRVDGDLERWARSKGLDPWAVARSIARKGTKKTGVFRKARTAARKEAKRFAEDAARDMVRRMNGG